MKLSRRLPLALFAAAAVALVLLLLFGKGGEESTPASANWGLAFHTEGEPPVANATSEKLAAYNALYIGDTGSKSICLTFDAGYEGGQTAAILDILKKHEVPAAFFLVGSYIESQPELVKRMAAEGHTVGNHTYSHPDMSAIADKAAFAAELEKTEAAYLECVGEEMGKYYRPPRGCYSEENLKLASELGYKTVFWSLAYVDWYRDDQPTREEAFAKLLPRIHGGAVVLLHSTSQTNADILDELLTKWEEAGYSFITLDELCAGAGSEAR